MPTASLPLVVLEGLEFKANLLAREDAQTEKLTRRWLAMERRLLPRFEALALEAANWQAAGGIVTRSTLTSMPGYQVFLAQTTDELNQYTAETDETITDEQKILIALGILYAILLIRTYYETFGLPILPFPALTPAVLEYLAGLAGNGSALRILLAEAFPEAVDAMIEMLVQGIALGKPPAQIAKEMAEAFGIGLTRALNIARTEQLRVYREASLAQYRESGVVAGYMRLSARDNRVCPACLFLDDGKTVYPLNVPFEEHPQGRCIPIPVLIGVPVVQWQNGMDWYLAQNEQMQKSILGKGRWEAWQAGEFELADVIKHVDDETWGGSFVPKALRDLIGKIE